MSRDRRIECNCCGEVWEADFFCEQCMNAGEEVDAQVPDPLWELVPIDGDTIAVRRTVYRSVCGNCCGGGHAGRTTTQTAAPPAAPASGVAAAA